VRKWFVISALVFLIGGGIVVLVFRPWESPIERHKRAYLAVRNGGGLQGRIRYACSWITGRAYAFHWWKAEANRHLEALVELGYLQQYTVVLSNQLPERVIATVRGGTIYDWDGKRPDFEFLSLEARQPNLVRIIAIKEDARRWAQLVRDVDVPR
jgi:hypothetical protein